MNASLYTIWSRRIDAAETADDLREVYRFLESEDANNLSDHELDTLEAKRFRMFQQLTGIGAE